MVGAERIQDDVPVSGEYDVVVCGGGPAGIGAAVSAARAGARTLLVEHLYHVGGMATSALLATWCDTDSGPVFAELEARMAKLGLARRHFNPKSHLHEKGRVTFDTETLKVVALTMLREAGAEVLFGTQAEEVRRVEGGVRGVLVVNKAGRSLIRARVVIDCTADGDVAASAGAEFQKGDPEDGRLQHVSFHWAMDGMDKARAIEEALPAEDLLSRIQRAHAAGKLSPPRHVFRPGPETFPLDATSQKLALTYWEIERVDPCDPVQVSATLSDCQLAVVQVIEFCRENVPGYEACRVGRLPTLLGTRESRRIMGEYVLTRDDVVSGRKFADGVTRACFYTDFHDSPPGITIAEHTLEHKKAHRPPAGDWYEIPYRCLVPRGVAGMLVAGRCISCDRWGQASMRIMPTCMYTGTAAGTAAGLAVSRGELPHELDGCEVRRQVLGDS